MQALLAGVLFAAMSGDGSAVQQVGISGMRKRGYGYERCCFVGYSGKFQHELMGGRSRSRCRARPRTCTGGMKEVDGPGKADVGSIIKQSYADESSADFWNLRDISSSYQQSNNFFIKSQDLTYVCLCVCVGITTGQTWRDLLRHWIRKWKVGIRRRIELPRCTQEVDRDRNHPGVPRGFDESLASHRGDEVQLLSILAMCDQLPSNSASCGMKLCPVLFIEGDVHSDAHLLKDVDVCFCYSTAFATIGGPYLAQLSYTLGTLLGVLVLQ
eukprot:759452-Hanusia_phi.AAC.1